MSSKDEQGREMYGNLRIGEVPPSPVGNLYAPISNFGASSNNSYLSNDTEAAATFLMDTVISIEGG